MKFKPNADYGDGSDAHLTGAEAYGRYGVAVAKLVVGMGGQIVFSGPVSGLLIGAVDPLWDAVAAVQYPSLEAFRSMVGSPEYVAATGRMDKGGGGEAWAWLGDVWGTCGVRCTRCLMPRRTPTPLLAWARYRAIEKHRYAGLAGQLNIRVAATDASPRAKL